jgi:hypothetical protein
MGIVAERPHDMTDLYMAPVVLGVDNRLEELSALSANDLRFRVALESDVEPRDAAERRRALIETVQRGLELHGWTLALNQRGLALSHAGRAVVLGLPANLREYLAD